MRRLSRSGLLGLGLGIALLALPFDAAAQITGTSHDFSAAGWNPGGEICQPCHTPHNADTTVSNAPLWNHEVTTTVFTLYSNPSTLNATMTQPSGVSLLCLSCHDGTVALENFGGTTTGTNSIASTANLGSDLSNDHPVSFVYNAALATADGQLYNPETQAFGAGTIETELLFGSNGSRTVECASCHDVHGTANPSLLRVNNAASALCLTCHNK